MNFLLRETLLIALGHDSNLISDASESNFSLVSSDLLPQTSESLIKQLSNLGKVYSYLDNLSQTQSENPYLRSIFDSLDIFLDDYRQAIVQIDSEVEKRSITWLIAYLEPFRQELSYLRSFIFPLIDASPLKILSSIHYQVNSTPQFLSSKFLLFQQNIQHVILFQLNGFIFFKQHLPTIFIEHNPIKYENQNFLDFLSQRQFEILLLIVNTAHKDKTLFEKESPPKAETLFVWITQMAELTSKLLSTKLDEQWPHYFVFLKSLVMHGRSDWINIMLKKLTKSGVSSFEMSNVLSSFGLKIKAKFELTLNGCKLTTIRQSPLDIVVTDQCEEQLSIVFNFVLEFAKVNFALQEIWNKLCDDRTARMSIFFLLRILSSISEYLFFIAITPSLELLGKMIEESKDFLQFKFAFSSFVEHLVPFFSLRDDDFIETVRSFSKKILEHYELIVCKDVKSSVFNKENVFRWKTLLSSHLFEETNDPEIWKEQVREKLKKILEGF